MPITLNGSGTITGISAGGLPSGTITSASLASDAIYLTAPAGAVCFVCQNTAPTGWLKSNGAAVSRTVYASLFAAIGTTFGAGDGSTTFNLPDLRGYFPRGWDDSRGVDSGRAFGSAQTDAIQNITGAFKVAGATGGIDGASGAFFVNNENASFPTAPNSTAAVGFGRFDASRQVRTASENRPLNIALLACIKF